MPNWTPEEHARFEVLLKQAVQDVADTLVSYIRHDREMDDYLADIAK